MRVTLRLCLLIGISLLVVACGTVAEPRPTFEPTTASQPRLSLEDEGEATEVEVASAGAVGEVATPEVHDDHEAAVATEAPADDHGHMDMTAAETAAPSEEHEHMDMEAAETAVPTEEHADDHEHAEATAVPTEEHADDHEHAEATEAPETTSVTVVINGREYVGEAEYGETVFRTFPNPDPGPLQQQFCLDCHNPDEPVPGIGPYLYGIAAREGGGHAAHDHGEGDALIEYLYTSIVEPDAEKAPAQVNPAGVEVDWSLDIMPENWGTVLSPQQIADLIAFLMSLDQVVESE